MRSTPREAYLLALLLAAAGAAGVMPASAAPTEGTTGYRRLAAVVSTPAFPLISQAPASAPKAPTAAASSAPVQDAPPKPLRTLDGNRDSVDAVVFVPDGKSLATACGHVVRFWNAQTGELSRTLDVTTKGAPGRVIFSGDGTSMACVHRDEWGIMAQVDVWDLAAGAKTGAVPVAGASGPRLLVPLGGRIAASCADEPLGMGRVVTVWDVPAGKPKASLRIADSVYSMVVSPDVRTVAIVSRDFIPYEPDAPAGDVWLRLWSVGDRECRLRIRGDHLAFRVRPVFSPDGSLLATSGSDEVIRLYDVATGRPVRSFLDWAQGSLCSLAFSPDGKMLASGEMLGPVRLWNVATGEQLGWPLGSENSSPPSLLAFSPDGKTLASASGRDKVVTLWDVSGAAAAASARPSQAGSR